MAEYGFEVYDSGSKVFSRSGRYPRILGGTPKFINDANHAYAAHFEVDTPPAGSIILVFGSGSGGTEGSGSVFYYYVYRTPPWLCWLYEDELAWKDYDYVEDDSSGGAVSPVPSPTLDTSAGPSSGSYPGIADPNTYGSSTGSLYTYTVVDTKPGIDMHVIAYG